MAEMDFDAMVRSAFDRALVYLSYRQRTELEVRNDLEKKHYPPEVIEAVMFKLKDYLFVDDRRYTDDYIEFKGQRQLKGRRRIKEELLRKGIHQDLVSSGLEAYDEEDELKNALTIARSYIKGKQEMPYQQMKMKLAGKLTGKGYGWEIIERVMAILDQDEEIQAFLIASADLVYEKALQIGERAKERYKKKSATDYELRMKVFGYLKQQGYETEIIQKVMEQLEIR